MRHSGYRESLLCSTIWRAGALALIVTTTGALAAGPAAAADSGTAAAPSAAPSVKDLRAAITAQREQIELQNETLQAQQRQLQALERRLDALSRQATPQVRAASYVIPPRPVDASRDYRKAADSQGQVAQAEGTDAVEKHKNVIEALSEEAGAGVLGKAGTFILEPSLEYLHNTTNRVFIQGLTIIPGITVGAIDISEVNRDTLTAAITGRYSITDRLQVDAKIPYVYRADSTTTRPVGSGTANITHDATGNDLGDIELGAHYQFTTGRGSLPILVGNLQVKTDTGSSPFDVPLVQSGAAAGLEEELPTGTGFWSIEPSVTAIFPSDPVVFFANVGYQWNIARDISSPAINGGAETEIDPGDGIKASVGFGFGINDRASFNLGFEYAFILPSSTDGDRIEGSDVQVGSFLTGVSYKVSDSTSLNLTVGIGATEAAPDARMLVRVPIKF